MSRSATSRILNLDLVTRASSVLNFLGGGPSFSEGNFSEINAVTPPPPFCKVVSIDVVTIQCKRPILLSIFVSAKES